MAAERLDKEEFFRRIDPDLCRYAYAFRESGFPSSVTMKYWREQDFQNLAVNIPEGHRRLILNMVTKLRTPEVKSADHRSSLLSKKVDESPRKMSLHPRRDISATFTGCPSKSTTQSVSKKFQSLKHEDESAFTGSSSSSKSSKSRKLDMLSPVERFIKSKEDELKEKTEEVMQKKSELNGMYDQIKKIASAVGRTGQRCSNCHQKFHTVRSCVGEKCESVFLCGDLSKHPDQKLAFQEKKRAITTLETSIKKISQELEARQTAYSRVTNSVNKSFEDILVEEFPDDYVENGVWNWLRVQQDVAYVKKNLKPGAVPSREMVRSVIEQKNEDCFPPALSLSTSSTSASKRRGSVSSCSPMKMKLASYGIKFPQKRSTAVLEPASEEEEEEQLKMATKLSLAHEPCNSSTSTESQDSNAEAANILLSLSKK